MNKPEPIQNVPPELEYLDKATRWLDTRFRIPGTDIRFGFDALLGLIPGAGDAISLLVSGGLVIVMARHGSIGPWAWGPYALCMAGAPEEAMTT